MIIVKAGKQPWKPVRVLYSWHCDVYVYITKKQPFTLDERNGNLFSGIRVLHFLMVVIRKSLIFHLKIKMRSH